MSEINIDDLTSGTIDGDGIFDKLMEATQVRLDDAFAKNRITATDYSTLLIQGIQTAMQQSIAFITTVQQADAQAELTKAQKLIADQELVNLQAQKVLLDKQALEADQSLIHLTAQTAIVQEGLATAQADTALRQQQLTNLQVEKLKLDQEVLLLTEQVAQAQAEVTLTQNNAANAETTNTNLLKQQLKIDAETALLTQKAATESAQTENTADPNSVIGKQIGLFQKQTDGFQRDAEQKAAKMLLDTWNVRQTTDGALTSPAGIGDTSIKEVVDTLKQGVNAASNAINISNPGGRATGANTAEISIVVEDGSGTLYYYVSENSTETGGTVLNQNTSQAVTTTGIQNVSITGLTTATNYYAHFVQINQNGVISDVESSSIFTTS